ncbi:hypothetical protein IFM89_028605 [Coptis chinensis]|uniref:RING-type domain-containing protein n=1 Tax=Coptis chinensis TaxID=261450 RepID=A0A835IFD9_9MAGN|nr:hypothetical protein IFM89_028605 [Coptis chinensis]
MDEESVKESLKYLENEVKEKDTFIEAVSSTKALLTNYYPSASPSLQESFYVCICHVASILQTRYTECELWVAGKELFEEAERLVVDSSERAYMTTCIEIANEHINKLVMDAVPPRPTLQVANELLATLGVVPGSSQLIMRGDNNTSQRASELMEEMVNSMGEISEFRNLIDTIEASLQGIGASRPIRSPPASKEVIENLPVISITEEIMARLGSDMQCVVCKENLDISEKMQELPCKHLFHLLCLKPWLVMISTIPVQSADMSCQRMIMPMRVGKSGRGRLKAMKWCCSFTKCSLYLCML